MSEPIPFEVAIDFPYAGVGEAAISCDGRHLAYAHAGEVHLVHVDDGSERRLGSRHLLRWSPADASTLALLKPGEGGVRVLALDGSERHLAPGLDNVRLLEWSWDGAFLAAVSSRESAARRIEAAAQQSTITSVQPEVPTGASVLSVIHCGTGACVFSTDAGAATTFDSMAWHPSGDRITVVAMTEHAACRDWTWRLFDLDISTGAERTRVGPSGREISAPAWSPDGSTLAFRYCPHPHVSAVRTVCGLMLDDSDEVRMVGEDYLVTSVQWAPDGRTLVCDGRKGVHKRIFGIDAACGRCRTIMDRPGRCAVRGMTADGDALLAAHQGFTSLEELLVISPEGGRQDQITHFSDSLNRYDLSEPEVVSWESFDGLRLEGLLVPPLREDSPQDPPTVVHLHGGPACGGDFVFDPLWQWLAADGFQVFLPVLRGSEQYGWVPPPTDETDLEDLKAGVEWLAQAGRCSPERIGVHGFSYGASLGALAVGRGDLFRAAVLVGGMYDLRMAFGVGLQGGWNATLADELGGKPWEAPDVYDRLSPVTYAPQVEAPVLLLHGETDVPEQAELYAASLRKAGKSVELIVYKGDGHEPSRPEHVRDRWQRTLDWFRKHLSV